MLFRSIYWGVFYNCFVMGAWPIIGLAKVLARIREFESRHGSALWSPAPLLLSLAERGQRFVDVRLQRRRCP